MHDPGSVHGAKARGQSGRQGKHGRHRQGTEITDRIGQRWPRDICGNKPRPRSVGIGVHDRRGENSAYLARRRDFVCETAAEIRIVGELGPDQLHGDHLPGRRLAQVDAAHSANAKAIQQAVRPHLLRVLRL